MSEVGFKWFEKIFDTGTIVPDPSYIGLVLLALLMAWVFVNKSDKTLKAFGISASAILVSAMLGGWLIIIIGIAGGILLLNKLTRYITKT